MFEGSLKDVYIQYYFTVGEGFRYPRKNYLKNFHESVPLEFKENRKYIPSTH